MLLLLLRRSNIILQPKEINKYRIRQAQEFRKTFQFPNLKKVRRLRKGKIRKWIISKRDNTKDIWRLYCKVISIQNHQINAKILIKASSKLMKEAENNSFDTLIFILIRIFILYFNKNIYILQLLEFRAIEFIFIDIEN